MTGPVATATVTPMCCQDHCTGCGACVAACPARALSLVSEYPDGRGRKRVAIAAARCSGCGTCRPACPREALTLAAAKR